MIRIKKGSNEFIVSNQSYKDIYMPLGYEIIEGEQETAKADENKSANADKYIEEEKESQIEISSNDDVVSSKQLKTEIGEDIEEDYGFAPKKSKGKRKQG